MVIRLGLLQNFTWNMKMEARNNHKDRVEYFTAKGFVVTPYICHVLSENGAHEKVNKYTA